MTNIYFSKVGLCFHLKQQSTRRIFTSDAKSLKLLQFIKILLILIIKHYSSNSWVVGLGSHERIREKLDCILSDLPKSITYRLLRLSSTLISKFFLQFLIDYNLSSSLSARAYPMEFAVGLKPHDLGSPSQS